MKKAHANVELGRFIVSESTDSADKQNIFCRISRKDVYVLVHAQY